MAPTQEMTTVAGDCSPNAVVPSMRKSCNFCFVRKRKCDGDGVNRCSLCKSRGPMQPCVYRERRRRHPTFRREGNSSNPENHGSDAAKVRATALVSSGGNLSNDKSWVGDAGELVANPTMKRCRMTASPATGLVGMQESQHLEDFVDCLGILNLASERNIRRAMVRIMMSAVDARQLRASEYDASPGVVSTEPVIEWAANSVAMVGVGRGESSGGAVTCMLWCATALGALVRGRPVEQVTGYVHLAREALGACFDEGTVDTARAYLIIAVLHHFLGDVVKRESYLAFARSIIDSLPSNRVPSMLEELLHFEQNWRGNCFRGTDDFSGDDDPPKITPFGGNEGVASFALWADRRIDQAFLEDMRSQGAFSRNTAARRVSESSIDAEDPGQCAVEGFHGTNPRKRPAGGASNAGGMASGPLPIPDEFQWKEADPPVPSVASSKVAEEISPEMEKIIRSGQDSEALSGVGGLFLHMDFAYLKIIRGEPKQAYCSLLRCVEILERYPGLCRYTTWTHLCHCLLAVFEQKCRRHAHHKDIADEARQQYCKVRHVYNSTRQGGDELIPPLEEWTSMADVCEYLFCRSLCAGVAEILSRVFTVIETPASDNDIPLSTETPSGAPAPPVHVPPTPPPFQEESSTSFDQDKGASDGLSYSPGIGANAEVHSSFARGKQIIHGEEDTGRAIDGDFSTLEETSQVGNSTGDGRYPAPELSAILASKAPNRKDPRGSGGWSDSGNDSGDGEPTVIKPSDGSGLNTDFGLGESNEATLETDSEFQLTNADLLEAADALLDVFGDSEGLPLEDGMEMTGL